MMYALFRKIFFLRDAESVHETVLHRLEQLQRSAAGRSVIRMMAGSTPSQPVEAMGFHFAHPLGIAAGFDKDVRVVFALQELGFAFVEVGTITPRPQPGNPRPRIWRFPEAEALVNALGFPGEGMEAAGRRLQALREGGLLRIPVGINIGKNADTPADEAISDYRKVFDHLYELGDYFVVNVSSPNTAGLRDMQAVGVLKPLLSPLIEYNSARANKPLLVKIAPDLADEDVSAVGRLARELNLAGVVAGNTTIRRDLVPRAATLERGGLSGAPQFPRTVELVRILRSELTASQTIIAAGGISSPERLQRILACGANLVQVYTPFIYLGPHCVKKLLKI
ncbi:quinone-dependent dihydroorotate dehydrogenase [candidate division KSB1 bacterium]|nr:MAG: quinone-dependent dihydroorotate dehydrogenase [candidate division KSB1 bacterium]